MDRFDGTAARQLLLVDEGETPLVWRAAKEQKRPALRVLRKDIYAELARRRRRAQIAARHMIDE